MKLIVLLFSFYLMGSAFSQDYQLLPDSCTFCTYDYTAGTAQLYNSMYSINPFHDTTVLGNEYMVVSNAGSKSIFGIRQTGNKLYGVVQDSTEEYLVMDFDNPEGDTIYNLYSEGIFYHAVVDHYDSTLVGSGVYHKYVELLGIKYNWDNSGWMDSPFGEPWKIVWNERGLCHMGANYEYGGVRYNVPWNELVIEVIYDNPRFCTSDPIYTNPGGYNCDNCTFSTNDLSELSDDGEFFVYPNPVSGRLNMKFNSNSEKVIRLVDFSGKLIIEKKTNLILDSWNLKNMQGIYLLMVEMNGSQYRRRVSVK